MNLPVFDPARIGFVTCIDRSGPVPDSPPLLVTSFAGNSIDRLVPVRHFHLRVGTHVVVPGRSPRLAEAGPDDRDVVACGHAEQGCCTTLPSAGSGRGDGQDGDSRDDPRQSDLAPA